MNRIFQILMMGFLSVGVISCQQDKLNFNSTDTNSKSSTFEQNGTSTGASTTTTSGDSTNTSSSQDNNNPNDNSKFKGGIVKLYNPCPGANCVHQEPVVPPQNEWCSSGYRLCSKNKDKGNQQ